MNIALMSHTKKQDLMVQFCTAYCGILSKHTVCATNATGRMVAEATGLPVVLWDERGSSVTANRILSDSGKKRGKQRAKVDAVAASIILQSYLDWLQLHPEVK